MSAAMESFALLVRGLLFELASFAVLATDGSSRVGELIFYHCRGQRTSQTDF